MVKPCQRPFSLTSSHDEFDPFAAPCISSIAGKTATGGPFVVHGEVLVDLAARRPISRGMVSLLCEDSSPAPDRMSFSDHCASYQIPTLARGYRIDCQRRIGSDMTWNDSFPLSKFLNDSRHLWSQPQRTVYDASGSYLEAQAAAMATSNLPVHPRAPMVPSDLNG